jgi:hypothetical protein
MGMAAVSLSGERVSPMVRSKRIAPQNAAQIRMAMMETNINMPAPRNGPDIAPGNYRAKRKSIRPAALRQGDDGCGGIGRRYRRKSSAADRLKPPCAFAP